MAVAERKCGKEARIKDTLMDSVIQTMYAEQMQDPVVASEKYNGGKRPQGGQSHYCQQRRPKIAFHRSGNHTIVHRGIQMACARHAYGITGLTIHACTMAKGMKMRAVKL